MDKKLHILFLCNWFPSRVNPLNGDFIQRHAEAVATKHKVTVVHIISDENLKKNIEINISELNNVRIIIGYLPKIRNPILKFFYFIQAFKKCYQHIPFYDVVHLNVTHIKGIVVLYLKWFKKKNYIISEHWTKYLFPNNKTIGMMEKIILKSIVKNATFVCPVSNNLKEHMIEFGLKGNYVTIPNVVDTSIFNISEKTSNSNTFTITHISHMRNDHKNVIGIINTIKKLEKYIPNLKFNLIGENSFKYNELIKKLELKNVQTINQIQYFEVAQYLKKSDLFVLFSNYENLPCVILEAFSCGVPVVSSKVGGIHEFFPNDFGILVPPKDEIAFKKAILKIYNSSIKINKKRMYEYSVENFGVHAICNLFTRQYFECINK